MADFPDVKPNDENLRLISSNQSYESVLTGDKKTAELSGDKWAATLQFSNRHGSDAAKLRAWLFSLGGSRTRFKYSPESISNIGTASGAGVVNGAGQTGSVLSTKGWDDGQELLFSAGDYIEANGELKIVTGDVATSSLVSYPDATNSVPSPFDPEGWLGAGDPDILYTSVVEANPSGESFVGEFEYVGPASMSIFQSNYQNFTLGETAFICFIFKPNPIKYMRLFLQKNVGGTPTTEELTTINGETGDFISGTTDPDEVMVEQLSNGYYLVQVKYTVQESLPYRGVVYCDSDFFFNPPNVGDKIKAQAAFFGKSGKFPGSVSYTGTNLMPSPFDPSGWSGVSDVDLSYSSVVEANPSGESFVGRFEYVGPGTANILIGDDTPFLSGDNIAFCFIVKPDGFNYIRATVQERPSGTNAVSFYVNLTSGEVESPSGSLDFTTKITELDNGYFLVQSLATGALNSDYRCVLWMQGLTGLVQAGEALKLQAAYFGKATDYPAVVLPADPNQFPALVEGTALIPIAPKLRNAPPDGSSIITDKPSATFRLENDDQAQFQVQGPLIYNASFSLLEDF